VEEARVHGRSPYLPYRSEVAVLSVEKEAIIVAFRERTLLPLDDCLYALQATIPQLTRSSLHRCLERNGISRLPDIEGDKPRSKKLATYAIGFFHIDLAEVRTAEGKLYLFIQVRNRPLWTSPLITAALNELASGLGWIRKHQPVQP
jgi:hypothetical protein